MSVSSAITFWLTSANRSVLLKKQEDLLPFTDTANDYQNILVDATCSYQPIEGFGFSLTGGSAYLINRLSPLIRSKLLREIFSTDDDGISTSYLRISIGASDLSKTTFSYNDIPAGQSDPTLVRFDIGAGDSDLIPLLKEIIAINPKIKIMGTPWSAPPWMKTNDSFIGGKLHPDHYRVYAEYLVKYLQTMKDNGIFVHAMTPQNEPLNHKNEPSMVMAAMEQVDFIKNHLGPALRSANFQNVELFCWDHNCDEKGYPLTVLSDPDVRDYLTGVAWHLYAGDVTAISDVHWAYPDMKMAFTEQWVGLDGNFADDLVWHMKNVMVGTIRNWSRIVLEWNLAADFYCGPHTPSGESRCVGAFTIGIPGEEIVRNVSYYVIAHAAKFVRPGSMRIFSSLVDDLPNVAFKTQEGGIVLLVLNETRNQKTFGIQFGEKVATATLDGGSVGSYLWQIA